MSTPEAKKRPADAESLVASFEALAIQVSGIDELLVGFDGLAISGEHGLESVKKRRKVEIPKLIVPDPKASDSVKNESSTFESSAPVLSKQKPQPFLRLDGPFNAYASTSNRLARLANTKKRSDWISKWKPPARKPSSSSTAPEPLTHFRTYDQLFDRNSGWSRMLKRYESPVGSQDYIPLKEVEPETDSNPSNFKYGGQSFSYSAASGSSQWNAPTGSISGPPTVDKS